MGIHVDVEGAVGRLMCAQIRALSAFVSRSVSRFAQAGSVRICWMSVLTTGRLSKRAKTANNLSSLAGLTSSPPAPPVAIATWCALGWMSLAPNWVGVAGYGLSRSQLTPRSGRCA